jgi:hypothetical protein
MAVNIPIWPGSASFFPGDTPFGFYDGEYDFQNDSEKVADWCAKRLGYPISDVELQDKNFYACFEEAVTEYGNQVNTYNIRDNLVNMQGASTGSNLTQKYVTPDFGGLILLSKEYGSEAGSGGRYNVYSASISVTEDTQVYDLTDTSVVTFESGSPANDNFEVRRIFHDAPPAIVRYYDPFIGTGMGSQNMLDGFGWGSYSPGVSFMMMPIYADVLRLQGIEFNDQIRKSAYSFQLSNNKLKLFPIPTTTSTVYFNYILLNDRNKLLDDNFASISDYSNAPYDNMTYAQINDVGKQWIRKYALVIAKEMLGLIRGKYSELPVPNSTITLNGSDLISNAQADKDALITELKEILEGMSRQAQLERKQAESDALQQQMAKIPLKIYVG